MDHESKPVRCELGESGSPRDVEHEDAGRLGRVPEPVHDRQNADVFPEGSGRLIKAGSKIHFNLHLHSYREHEQTNLQLGIKLYPKGTTPSFVVEALHTGDSYDSIRFCLPAR
ncbi:MAG: hypothetical protein QM736_03365 [Vicinamibacterales bacterium]